LERRGTLHVRAGAELDRAPRRSAAGGQRIFLGLAQVRGVDTVVRALLEQDVDRVVTGEPGDLLLEVRQADVAQVAVVVLATDVEVDRLERLEVRVAGPRRIDAGGREHGGRVHLAGVGTGHRARRAHPQLEVLRHVVSAGERWHELALRRDRLRRGVAGEAAQSLVGPNPANPAVHADRLPQKLRLRVLFAVQPEHFLLDAAHAL